MITDTKNKILGYIHTHKQARPYDLVRAFGLSQVAIHKQLKKLLDKEEIKKVGKPPLVFYVPAIKNKTTTTALPSNITNIIEDNYLYISPIGELLYGFSGFTAWTKGINEEKNLPKLAKEYIDTIEQLKTYKTKEGLIDATEKLKNTFKDNAVDTLFYADFYSIPKFGKTKLGQLVLYAKQSQNKAFINEIALKIKPFIETVINKFAIDAVVFIPPTVPRKVQFMSELKADLKLNIPHLELVKVASGDILVAQKTLSRLEERIVNARDTIFLKSNEGSYSNILLIDDAMGSGSTCNETAKKLKNAGIGKNTIIAFAVVGSFKGFEVIREV